MPGKPFTKPWIDKETRQPWGLFLNKSVVGFSASLNGYDAEDSGEELRLLDEVANNYQQVVIAASEAGSIGLYLPYSSIVGRSRTGNVRNLTVEEVSGGWNDYIVVATSIPLTGPNAPTSTLYRDGLYLPAFTGVGVLVNEVWAAIHIEHDYKSGTALYPHVHWSHIIAAPSGDIKWGIEYSVAKGHQVGTYPTTTTVYKVQEAGAQYTHHIAEVSDGDSIPATNVEPDSVVLMRVFRDPSDVDDTFADNAYLIAIDLHYQSDGTYTTGKVSPFTKTF